MSRFFSMVREYFLSRPNYSSPFAPPELANVSLTTSQNIYLYDKTTLWIAYGLSMLFTALAVLIGMVAMLSNGESYSNSFSSIVRVARTADLSAEVRGKDGSGSDPLPPYLKEARLDVGACARRGMGEGGSEVMETPPENQELLVFSPSRRSS